MLERATVAVCYFVVLSGFITHWAYANRDFSQPGELKKFYAKRVGRVAIMSWIALGFAMVMNHARRYPGLHVDGSVQSGWTIVRCFCLVETWGLTPHLGPFPGWDFDWSVLRKVLASFLESLLIVPFLRRCPNGSQCCISLVSSLFHAAK